MDAWKKLKLPNVGKDIKEVVKFYENELRL
jgi:hypothetical protein